MSILQQALEDSSLQFPDFIAIGVFVLFWMFATAKNFWVKPEEA